MDRATNEERSSPVHAGPANVARAPGISGKLSDLIEDDVRHENVSDVAELQQLVSESAANVTNVLHDLHEKFDGIRSEIARLRTDEAVLSELHERNRALSEEFHERHVLTPLFLMLIGIADRCGQRIAEAAEAQQKCEESGNRTVMHALEYIRQDRRADLIELENLLANYGVERFETPGERFDPSTQRCAKQVNTDDSSSRGLIDCRLLPGYRRDGRVIRQECVSVYVSADEILNNEDGGT